MVDSVNDSLPTDFTIDGNPAHTSGTVLEVCVAAKVDDDMGDDSCIFVFFADTWEIPDCSDLISHQLPKLDPGHAYHLPSSGTLAMKNRLGSWHSASRPMTRIFPYQYCYF